MNDVPMVLPASRQDVRLWTEELHRSAGTGLLDEAGPANVLMIFDDLPKYDSALTPVVAKLPDGVEGVTYSDGRVCVSEETYLSADRGDGRARFTIAHEIAHGVRHRHQIRHCLVNGGAVRLYRRADIPRYRDPEWQADTFAGLFLMPPRMLRQVALAEPLFGRVQAVMRTFQVSFSAAQFNLAKAGIPH